MRVGLASDSSGNAEALKRAFELLMRAQKCERFFFLGGNWADVDALAESLPPPTSSEGIDFISALGAMLENQPTPQLAENIVRVSEKDGPGGEDNVKVIEMFAGQLCLLVHNKADLTKEDIINSHLIFHGKAKNPGVVKIGARAFITPGSIGVGEGSVAVLTARGSIVDVEFYDLAGRLTASETVNVASGTRMSAR